MHDIKTVLNFISSWISHATSKEFIDTRAKFHDYSIKLTDFCTALNAEYQLNLDPTIIYAFPTPALLAAHILTMLSSPIPSIHDKASVTSDTSALEPIAIVGMACRMPGHINSPEDYWNLLINGRDAITEVPASRWDIEAYYDPNPDAIDKMQTRFGGFIDHPEFFDSSFFNISPKEALEMDPQQRMFLQVCWEALENANIAPDSLNDSNTGVIVGMSINDYDELKSRYQTEIVRNPYHNISRYLSATAGRVSYFLNLHGPSYAMDVACASSLVATHNAVKLLQYRETDCVLVGGVNLLLDPEHTIGYDKAKMLSPDGRCKSFDESANGYVRSEGCGVLVLKRLSDAIAANHKILAVIKGSAVNQDGSTNGITAPNEQAQVDVIEQALQHAQLTPDDIGYIETHGTGTRLGDPIEFNAIKRVYSGRKKKSKLYLGAVKSNIGHLEAMSGLAGLMKAVLCLQHHIIPKNLHFSKLNPLIDLSLIHAELPLENTSWVADKTRHASVSGFSFIGTNAHVILEEAPISPIVALETGDWVICLSAKTVSALEQLRQDYIQHLESHPDERIQDIVYTANTGRAKLDIKAYFEASSKGLLLDNLKRNQTTDEPECNPIKGNKLSLPNYPFERVRYWLKPSRQSSKTTALKPNQHPLLGEEYRLASLNASMYHQTLSLEYPDFIRDHQLDNIPVLSGSAYWSALMSCAKSFGYHAILQNIQLLHPLAFGDRSSYIFQTLITTQDKEHALIEISSRDETLADAPYILHVKASIEIKEGTTQALGLMDIQAVKARCSMDDYSGSVFYDHVYEHTQIRYQHHHLWLTHVYIGEHEALGQLRDPEIGEKDGFIIYPGCLESTVQLAVTASFGDECYPIYVPINVGELSYEINDAKPCWAYIRYEKKGSQLFAHAYLLSETGTILVSLCDIEMQPLSDENLAKIRLVKGGNYQHIHLTGATIKFKRVLIKPYVLAFLSAKTLEQDATLSLDQKDLTVIKGVDDYALNKLNQVFDSLVLAKNQALICYVELLDENIDSLLINLLPALLMSKHTLTRLCLVLPKLIDDRPIDQSFIPYLALYSFIQRQYPMWPVTLICSDFANSQQQLNLKWLNSSQKFDFNVPLIVEARQDYQVLSWQTRPVSNEQDIDSNISQAEYIFLNHHPIKRSLVEFVRQQGATVKETIRSKDADARLVIQSFEVGLRVVFFIVENDQDHINNQLDELERILNDYSACIEHLVLILPLLPSLTGSTPSGCIKSLHKLELGVNQLLHLHSCLRVVRLGEYPTPEQILATEDMCWSILSSKERQSIWAFIQWSSFLEELPEHVKSSFPRTLMDIDMPKNNLSGITQRDFLKYSNIKTPLNSEELVAYLETLDPEKREEVLLEKIRELIAGIIGRSEPSQLNPDKDFFELGIDSLMAMELRQRVKSSLGLQLDNTIIFQYSTIKKLVSYISDKFENNQSNDLSQSRFKEKDRYELLYSQEYGLKFSNNIIDVSKFNISIKTRLNNMNSLDEVISKINNYIENNDTLSINFSKDNDGFYMIYKKINHPEQFIEVIKKSSRKIQDITNLALLTSFTLLDDYLFRFIVIPGHDGEYDVLFVAHHIISDLFSLYNLKKQLMNGVKKQPRLIQAKFNEQQRSLYHGNIPSNILDFWLNKFNRLNPLILHQQQPQNKIECLSFDQFQLCHHNDFMSLSSRYQSTGFNISLAISSLIFNRMTNNQNIQFVIPMNSRDIEASETVHGMFIKDQLFIAEINWNQPFELFNQFIQADLQESIEHYYPMNLLLETLINKSLSNAFINVPIFIGYIGNEIDDMELNTIILSEQVFELLLYFGIDRHGSYKLNIWYKKSLFGEEFINKLFGSFKSVINALIDDYQKMNYQLISSIEPNDFGIVKRKKMMIKSNFLLENLSDLLSYFIDDVELVIQENSDALVNDLFKLSDLGSDTLHIILIDLNQLIVTNPSNENDLLEKIKDLTKIISLNYIVGLIYHEEKTLNKMIKNIQKIKNNNVIIFDLNIEKNNNDLYAIELVKIIAKKLTTLGV